jgi:hypothetical protein
MGSIDTLELIITRMLYYFQSYIEVDQMLSVLNLEMIVLYMQYILS